jgi:receptor protein-tyrosine kinase
VGTIEQAAKRLEQLKKAGVDINTGTTEHLRAEATDGTIAEPLPLRVARELDARPVAPPLADARQSDVLHHVSVGVDPAAMPEGAALAGSPVRPVHPLRTAISRPHVDIDLARLSANGYVTPQSPRSRLAEEFRVIKRPLLVNARGKSAAAVLNSNRIMVTSSTAGEGKTYVSLNLALSLAMELETHVLLVDADATRPAVLDRLALPPAKGLLDLLVDPAASPNSLILSTNVDRLSILPAGTPQEQSTELLASDGMSRLVERLTAEDPRRIVLFDAPPLLGASESRVLASHMGQVILVIAADDTPQGTVAEALATVENCPVVLTLLNRVSPGDHSHYYGSYGSHAR